jgi:hypothetical protein
MSTDGVLTSRAKYIALIAMLLAGRSPAAT